MTTSNSHLTETLDSIVVNWDRYTNISIDAMAMLYNGCEEELLKRGYVVGVRLGKHHEAEAIKNEKHYPFGLDKPARTL